MATEKDREELIVLKQQMEDLERKLLEKDEILKSAGNYRDQMNSLSAKLDEVKHQSSEKDSLVKSTQRQLSDAKVPVYLCCLIYNLAWWVEN